MIDANTANSPGWWLRRLLLMLSARQDRYARLDRYYRGDPDLPAGSSAREAYRRFQRKARTNFAELVVEAVRERMQPAGFRTGADSDATGDGEAWRIWQANSLDADSALVHRAMLSMGDAYVIVGDIDDEIGVPRITPEDPRQVVTAHDPMRRRKSLAALKTFVSDEGGTEVAYLYLPGQIWVATRKRSQVETEAMNLGSIVSLDGWEWLDANYTRHAGVPVVRFANRPDMRMCSTGEFEDVIDVLDRINHMLLQRMVIATIQAFRQRAIKGVPSTDADGNPIDYAGIFTADPGALWLLPDDAEIWESGTVDLGPILAAVRHDVQDLAAATRTPLFYLTPDAASGSAEGASLAREGLVFKTRDRLSQTGESWEQVMSIAFDMMGDTKRAARPDMEILWAPPEMHSLAERYDAASKAIPAGVPWRTVMTEVLQFSPQQVDRMEAERITDAFLNAPPTPAPSSTAAPMVTAPVAPELAPVADNAGA